MKQSKARSPKAGSQGATWLPLALIAGGVILLGAMVWMVFGRGGAGGQAQVEVRGAPRLKADQQKVDLGDVQLGRTVQVEFKLSNVGDQPLRFSEAPWIEVVEGC